MNYLKRSASYFADYESDSFEISYVWAQLTPFAMKYNLINMGQRRFRFFNHDWGLHYSLPLISSASCIIGDSDGGFTDLQVLQSSNLVKVQQFSLFPNSIARRKRLFTSYMYLQLHIRLYKRTVTETIHKQ